MLRLIAVACSRSCTQLTASHNVCHMPGETKEREALQLLAYITEYAGFINADIWK